MDKAKSPEPNLQKQIEILNKELKKKTAELTATKKSLKEEQNRRRQSSIDLKKRIKELTEKNEDLSKQLEAVRNIQLYEEKPSNSSFVVDELLKRDLQSLRIQHNQDLTKIKTLKGELKVANEKINDLENVLEAHQLEIEEERNNFESPSKVGNEQRDSKSASKKKNIQPGSTEASKLLNQLVSLKKISNNILADLNSPSYKEMRSSFDEQLLKMKQENNCLVNSITKVKLTTRSFEALEQDLMNLRVENNQRIKTVRKEAMDTATKLNALYKEFTTLYPQRCLANAMQYGKELEMFRNLSLWDKEKTLQEEIVKKLQNEREFLRTIISKQDDI